MQVALFQIVLMNLVLYFIRAITLSFVSADIVPIALAYEFTLWTFS
jgi:hypothetical protein